MVVQNSTIVLRHSLLPFNIHKCFILYLQEERDWKYVAMVMGPLVFVHLHHSMYLRNSQYFSVRTIVIWWTTSAGPGNSEWPLCLLVAMLLNMCYVIIKYSLFLYISSKFLWQNRHAAFGSKNKCVTYMGEKEEIWFSPMTKKRRSDNTKTPPNTWITRRLWTDLWRLVGDEISTKLVWLIITFYLDFMPSVEKIRKLNIFLYNNRFGFHFVLMTLSFLSITFSLSMLIRYAKAPGWPLTIEFLIYDIECLNTPRN